MQAWLAGLFEPARTARDRPDPFRWHDKRPVNAQIASGLRRVALGGAVFAVIVAAFGSLGRISRDQSPVAWATVVASAVIMIFTAPRWARFGVLGLGFPVKALLLRPAYLREFGEFAAFSVFVALLTYRFWKTRPAKTTLIDRLALTAFILCSLDAAAVQRVLPALIGLGPLAIAWCVARGSNTTNRNAAARASMKEKRL